MVESEMPLDNLTLKGVASEAIEGAEVLSVKTERAVAPGEHYLSTLLRVNVEYRRNGQEEKTNFILKAHPPGILSEIVRQSRMFSKEVTAYNKILSRINEAIGKNITPERLGPAREDVLVLEDLKPKGFRTRNRVDRLDFEHASATLKALADFHAASIKLHRNDPGSFEEMKTESMYTESNGYVRSYVVSNIKTIGDEFEKVPDLKKYSARLRDAAEKTWEAAKEAMVPREDRINVFCHGDLWTTNILFGYDSEQNVNDLRFVDFQFCRWGSPAFDLQMLFTTSLRDRASIPRLTDIYLERLNAHLFPNILTGEDLEKEMRRLDCFGFITSLCTMPICILDPENPLNFGETTADDYRQEFPQERSNPYLTALRYEGYLKIIPEYLEFYDKMGLF